MNLEDATPTEQSSMSEYEKKSNYEKFIEDIKANKTLMDLVDKLKQKDPRVLNLLSPEWYSILNNCPLFQEYKDGKIQFYEYTSKNNKNLVYNRITQFSKVMVVSVFAIVKLNMDRERGKENLHRISIVESKPLDVISMAICKHLKKKIMFNANFYVNGCKGVCLKCRQFKSPENNNWCIQNTMVYNGTLNYGTREYCETLFSGPTRAILTVEINTSYSFAENCRIAGQISSIIFVGDDSSVTEDGSLALLNVDKNFVPSIEPEMRKSDQESEAKRMKISDNAILGIPDSMSHAVQPQENYTIKTTNYQMPNL